MLPRTIATGSSIALLMLGSCALPSAAPAGGEPQIIAEATPNDAPGIHNLMEVTRGVYSGSMPEGDAGFETLRELGVKTVISVDAARPDVERARDRDMRYVHVPVEYAGIDRDERWDLARAVRDLPRPIFVHCHHGKHRGPAAAVIGLELTGELSPDEALAYLEAAGTSPNYPGLWQCAREAGVVPTTELDAWHAELPEVAEVGGFVAGMAVLDRAHDRIGLVRQAGWGVPAAHPDLVPAALAGQVADVLRTLSEQTDEPEYAGARLVADLRAAADDAAALERTLDGGDRHAAGEAWKLVAASCKDCHAEHRDQ